VKVLNGPVSWPPRNQRKASSILTVIPAALDGRAALFVSGFTEGLLSYWGRELWPIEESLLAPKSGQFFLDTLEGTYY
jgi:hypothetical protein